MSELQDAVAQHGSKAAAARALGIPVSTLKDRLRKAPKGDEVREVTLTSTAPKSLEDATKELQIDLKEWRITDLEYGTDAKDKRTIKLKAKSLVPTCVQKALESSVRALNYPTRAKVPVLKARASKRLLEIGITDLHMGKRAWAEECGEDYDLDIARSVYDNAIRDTLSLVDPYLGGVSEILLLAGSDYLQVDNPQGTTVSGTKVDSVDTRFGKVFEVGFRAIADAADELSKIAPVRIVYLSANHDATTSWAMAFALKQYFSGFNLNVSVCDSPRVRKYISFGKVLLGLTHGHDIRMSQLPQVMALEAKQYWSEATTREFHCGHLHRRGQMQSLQLSDDLGVVTRVLPALSRSDAWHDRHMFVGAKQGVQSFLFDAEYGLTAQFEVTARNV